MSYSPIHHDASARRFGQEPFGARPREAGLNFVNERRQDSKTQRLKTTIAGKVAQSLIHGFILPLLAESVL
jgi:hypothetical protein